MTDKLVLRVQCKAGRFVVDSLRPESTVWSLQKILEEKSGIKPHFQKVLSGFPPKQLPTSKPSLSLTQLRICSGDTVIVSELETTSVDLTPSAPHDVETQSTSISCGARERELGGRSNSHFEPTPYGTHHATSIAVSVIGEGGDQGGGGGGGGRVPSSGRRGDDVIDLTCGEERTEGGGGGGRRGEQRTEEGKDGVGAEGATEREEEGRERSERGGRGEGRGAGNSEVGGWTTAVLGSVTSNWTSENNKTKEEKEEEEEEEEDKKEGQMGNCAVMPYSQPTLVRKVVPADNSCLFRCISYLLSDDRDDPSDLRQVAAGIIISDSDRYSSAVLGRSSQEYVQWLLKEQSWGGAIELSVFSDYYQIELDVVDVQSQRIDRFGEDRGYSERALLIYDGIHYDPLVMEGMGGSFQQVFPVSDQTVLVKAQQLAREAQQARQYTDVTHFSLRCLSCGAALRGQSEAQAHATTTGHINFGEI